MAKVQKTETGTWTVRLSLTDPLTGRRIQRRVSARTRRLLDAEVARIRAEWNSGSWIEPDKTTVGQWLETWHSTYKAEPSSRNRAGTHIRNHIAGDDIGSIPLVRLRYAHVQDWIDRKVAAGYATNTIRQMRLILSMGLTQAVRRQLIPSNPASAVVMPKANARRWCVLDEDQARRIVTEDTGQPEHALWVLAVTLGLRRGELLALVWSDINFDAETVQVARTQTINERGQRVTKDGTKTASSRRTIRVPKVAIAALKRHRARQNERRLWAGDLWQDNGYVFDSGLGEQLPESEFYRSMQRLKRSLSLPDALRPHDLRHTAATLALLAGVPITAVANMLGHANAAITLRTYAHVVKSMEDEAAARIDALYQNNSASYGTGTE